MTTDTPEINANGDYWDIRDGWTPWPPKKYRKPDHRDYDQIVEVSPNGHQWIPLPLLCCRPGCYVTKFDGKLAAWVDARVEVVE